MSELLERVKLSNLVYGKDIPDVFKQNSIFFYEKYRKSDKEVLNVSPGNMKLGYFYHLHYKDDSNWIKYSPIFTIDFKKFDNLIIIYGINFNFIPIEIRVSIFDKFFIEQNFEKNVGLVVDYEGCYKELLKYGYEWAIVEYNMAQIVLVHQINMNLVPRFLYSGHPVNKYDPKKLYEIWRTKLETREKRHSELSKLIVKDMFDISSDINKNFVELKDHINRIQKSYSKYGK